MKKIRLFLAALKLLLKLAIDTNKTYLEFAKVCGLQKSVFEVLVEQFLRQADYLNSISFAQKQFFDTRVENTKLKAKIKRLEHKIKRLKKT